MAHNQYYAQLRAMVGRPATPATPKGGDTVTFQIMDVVVSDHLAAGVCRRALADKAADAPLPARPAATAATATMFGVTRDGRSVCCHVSGFRPSCHVRFSTREGMQAVERWLRTGRRADVDYRTSMEQHFNFAGFTWDTETGARVKNNYLRIDSPTVEGYGALKWIAGNLARHDLEVVEHDGVPLYTKFYDATQLTPFQWVTVTAADIVDEVVSSCDVELRCRLGDWVDEPALTAPAPYLFASCDIEAHSASGEFPNKLNAGDAAFMVGVTLQRFGGGLRPCEPQGGADAVHVSFVYDDTPGAPAYSTVAGADGTIHVLRYGSERAMLEGWRDCLCVWLDVDVVMWYNGFRFDLPYMAYRVLGRTPCPVSCRLDAAFPAVGSRFFQFSKFVRECTPVRMKQITSSAMGDNEVCVWEHEYGRITMDLYDIVCKREKMPSYSLDSVCRKVLGVGGGTVTWRRGGSAVTGTGTRFTKLAAGDAVQLAEEFYTIGRVVSDTALELAAVPIDIDADVVDFPMAGRITKLDLPYKRMHELYGQRQFDAIIDYCCRDCVAPLRLLWKLRYFLNDFQMCRITFTPLQQLLSRGQGIKGLNQVIRFAHAKGFLLNQFRDMEQVDYQGATVVEPEKGFHTAPVVTLDFASLYPSIIISRWMCWSTVVTDERYANVPGIQYHDIPVSETVTYRFACNVDAVCPELLKALLAARKATKREMFAAGDAALKALLNAKQLAEKVCCNSVYGLTGAKTGLLRCVAIASATTAYGRHMLELTKRLAVEHLPGVSIIYGDSVTPDTPIPCRDAHGRIMYRAIQELGNGAWVPSHGGKEECPPLPGVEVWTERGFTPITRVIRHACGKPLKRVWTPSGVVDVTTDHSLLRPDGARVTPSDVGVGQELMHAPLPSCAALRGTLTVQRAFAWGMFFVGGRAVSVNASPGLWAITSTCAHALARVQTHMVDAYPMPFCITRREEGPRRCYALSAVDGDDHAGAAAELVAEWRALFFGGGAHVRVPDAVLQAPEPVRRAFWEGLCSGDAHRTVWRMRDKVAAAGVFAVASSLGINMSVQATGDADEPYRLVSVSGPEAPHAITRIDDLPPYTGPVYDLETGNHHFAAGVGRMVVHNTDSVMMKFHDLPGTRAGIEEAWRQGEEAAEWITAQLANGVVLECEKVYCPYLLVMKKCYAAYKYEGEGGVLPAQPCRDVKGLELAKRDTSKFIRQAQSRIINCLLNTADRDAAVGLVSRMIEDVCLLRVPLDEFVTSKSLRKEYKNANVVQQEVNRRRQARAPGSEFKPGERVPMVAVERRGKGAPLLTERDSACELMDDPEYVAAQGWRPNRRYYLTELHRKVARVLFDDKGRLGRMFDVALAYTESLKYRSIVPFRLPQKLARCAAAPQ